MTRSTRQLLLLAILVALVVGIILPAQLGRWVQNVAGWLVSLAQGVAG
jgi:hypothetical protein